MNLEIIIFIVLGLLFIWNLVLSVYIYKIVIKNKELFKGDQKGDIYSLINNYLLKMRKIENQNESIIGEFGKITENYAGCFQRLGVVRYNPFKDIGGDQSFSLAFLDKKDNGIVLTSILSREGNRSYAKPIKNKKSEYHLSKEELQAINLAEKK